MSHWLFASPVHFALAAFAVLGLISVVSGIYRG